jgi:hypothetical protein
MPALPVYLLLAETLADMELAAMAVVEVEVVVALSPISQDRHPRRHAPADPASAVRYAQDTIVFRIRLANRQTSSIRSTQAEPAVVAAAV